MSEEVWILLTRHRIDTRRPSEFISLHAEYDDGHPDTPKSFADTSRTQGVYTDNVHVLVRTTKLRKGRIVRTDMTLGAGDRPLVRCLRHDISKRILRRPFRRRRLHRNCILVSDHALGRDTTQAPLRPQGIGRSDSQDVRRKSHPVHLHAKPAVPPARAPVDDTTGTVSDNADRGCIARTTRRACQRNGYLGSRRTCLRVRDPSSSPAFARSFKF